MAGRTRLVVVAERTRNAVVAAAVLALLATACSAGGSGGGAPAGVMRIGLERPHSLDPSQARYPVDTLVVDQLFDGLTAYDAATLEVRPSIAARWEGSPDQKSWTFFLRPGAKFSNGRAIAAEDVRYTLERIAGKGSTSPAGAQLEAVVGYRAFNDGESGSLEGVSAPAAGTVKVELSYPLSSFPAVLGYPSFGIVPREAVEAPTPAFAEQPIGSGPFMIRSRSADVLRLMPAPGVKMALRGLEVHMGRDSNAPYAAFLRGQLDWTQVPAERVEQVASARGRAGFQPLPAQLMYGFNLKNRKFQDVRFREAIVRAIDRAGIVKVLYGDRVRLTSGVVAAGVPGFQADACGEKCQFNPDKSRQLLEETFGSRAIPEVRIDYDDDPTHEAVALAMQTHLRAVGIPTALRSHPYADYLKFASTGQAEIFPLAWWGYYATPDAFLAPLFQTGQPDNVTGYASTEFDDLIRAAREEPDRAKSLAIYQDAERRVMSELPIVPLAQYEIHTLVAPRVRNLTMSAFSTFDATRVELAG